MEYIHVDKKKIRITKEICESILLLFADVEGIREFKAGQPLVVDLEMDDFTNITPQDIIELIQERWQVRLL